MFPHKGAFTSIASPSNLAPSAVPIIAENPWLSQSAYQNVDASTVDWAAVAQQWIHMKESFGPVNNDFPIAPPPPRISQPTIDYEEQGEAPMEVEHDDEPTPSSRDNSMPLSTPPPPKNAFPSNNWSNNGESSNRQKPPHQKQWNNKRESKENPINGPKCTVTLEINIRLEKNYFRSKSMGFNEPIEKSSQR